MGLNRVLRSLRPHLPPLNFITLHYAYFLFVCLIASVIIWGSSTPSRHVSYIDSLFLAVSAMTLAGLNTVNLSELNTFQQFILFLLILLGSAILVSSIIVYIRKKAFERKFTTIIEEERRRRKARKATVGKGLSSPHLNRSPTTGTEPVVDGIVRRGRMIHTPEAGNSIDNPGDHPPAEMEIARDANRVALQEQEKEHQPRIDVHTDGRARSEPSSLVEASVSHIRFTLPTTPRFPLAERAHTRILSMEGIGARSDLLNHPRKSLSPMYPIPLAALTEEKFEGREGTHKYFISGGFIGRNSQFHSLTVAERERLGGYEYRAVVFLAVIVPVYFVLWQLLGCLGLGAWTAHRWSGTTRANGFNPWWYVL